jgi:hypothetical protein
MKMASILQTIGSTLASVAPTAAGLFLGPLGATAVTGIEKVLGIAPDPTSTLEQRASAIQNAVTAGLTPEQLVAMKQADDTLKQQFINAGITLAQTDAADRASARDMQVSTKTWVTPALACLVVVAAAIGEGYAMTHAIPAGSEVVFGRILGTLDSALILVLSFYFGSSSSTDTQHALLNKALDSTPPAGGKS